MTARKRPGPGELAKDYLRTWKWPAILALIITALTWPIPAFHGNARWVGEAVWAGCLLMVAAVIAVIDVRRHADERKLRRLRTERLRIEGNLPSQIRARQRQQHYEEQQRLKEQQREQNRREVEERKQRLRSEIEREERLRNERLRRTND